MGVSRFLRGAMILTIAGIIVKIFGAVNKIFISRMLGGEGIGLYQMAYPIYSITTSLATAGIPIAVSIMIAEKLAERDMSGANRVFKVSLTALTITGIVFGILLYGTAEWMVETHAVYDARAKLAIMALAPAIPIVTMLSCFRGYFQGFQNMLPTGTSQIGEQIVRVTAMFGLAWLLLHKGLEYAAAGAAFATFPGALMGLIVLLYYYGKQRHLRKELQLSQNTDITQEGIGSIVKRLFVLAIPVSMANIMLPIMAGIDLFIVPQRLGEAGFSVEEATTLFGYLTGMANSLVNLPIILTASLAASLVPAISEAHALKQYDRIVKRTETAMKIAALVTIPSFIGMAVLATPISSMLYATPHAGGPIAVMSLSIFLLGIQQVTTGTLQGMGHTAIPMINLAISAVAKVGLSWYLTAIPGLGVNGAAWATNADFGIAAVLNIGFVYYYTQYRVNGREMAKIGISALIMGLSAWATHITLVTALGNTAAVWIAIIVAIIVYGGVLLATRTISRADLEEMPIIGKRVKRS